jgi:hypothetical protein
MFDLHADALTLSYEGYTESTCIVTGFRLVCNFNLVAEPQCRAMKILRFQGCIRVENTYRPVQILKDVERNSEISNWRGYKVDPVITK